MRLSFVLFCILSASTRASEDLYQSIQILLDALSHIVNFMDEHYYEINFDGLLGVVIAESQLFKILKLTPYEDIKSLVLKCELVRLKLEPILPDFPFKYKIFKRYLLNPNAWENNSTFVQNRLKNLGIYHEWTAQMILDNKAAIYKGTPTDVCMSELLEQASTQCRVSPLCYEMMLAKRIDTGYLLSHRLLYLQIARIKGCNLRGDIFTNYVEDYCSLMLKEAKTNKMLGFPQHDIILEQILFCGMEGFEEFLTSEFRSLVVKWKSPYGCYCPEDEKISRRAANRIDYGCTDHATGLGAAALALNLRYIIQKLLEQ